MKAFVAAEKILRQLKSKMIFTVHDELVVDMHPDEFSFVQKIKEAMENAVGGISLSVGVNSGDDYEQASK
jgi:DNA polymerase I-like protein with 3'-5' exonuclease and polymerase domains